VVSADGPGAPSLGGQFFDDFYREQGEDPWGFTDRWYEQRKRAVTLASLPRPRFRRALEVGCSVGVLTSDLAPRCDELLALDVAGAAVALARERTRTLPSVRVEQMAVPAQWPEGTFDLVVLSEVGYYLSLDELTCLCDRSIGSLAPDGVLVACHWRHPVEEYPLRGDTVHAVLRSRTEVVSLARHEEEDFLLDVLVRPPAVSVAGQTGLLG
jgi:SAM-dependent methyltransferase